MTIAFGSDLINVKNLLHMRSDLRGKTMLYLASASNDASKYVGATFTIDGGISWGGKSW